MTLCRLASGGYVRGQLSDGMANLRGRICPRFSDRMATQSRREGRSCTIAGRLQGAYAQFGEGGWASIDGNRKILVARVCAYSLFAR